MDNKLTPTANKPAVNVPPVERLVSIGIGSILLLSMLQHMKKTTFIKSTVAGFLIYRGISGHCHAYGLFGKKSLSHKVKNIHIRTSMIVNTTREEAYMFWRKLDNLPLFMKHLDKVEVVDENRSAWTVNIPMSPGRIRWDATIISDIPGELISWGSLPGADIQHAGTVRFNNAGVGQTKIEAEITYRAPLGTAGAIVSKLLTPAFEASIRKDLEGFKQYMETGMYAV